MKKYILQILRKKNQERLKSQAGLTLVELVMVMGLMSIFMLVLTDIVSAALNVQTSSETVSSVAQDGRYILARFDYDIQQATSITTPAALGANGATLALVIGGVTNTYSIVGGDLQLVNGAGTSILNGSDTTISAINFHRLGNAGGKDTIRVTFTVTSKVVAKSGAETRTFTTTLGRR